MLFHNLSNSNLLFPDTCFTVIKGHLTHINTCHRSEFLKLKFNCFHLIPVNFCRQCYPGNPFILLLYLKKKFNSVCKVCLFIYLLFCFVLVLGFCFMTSQLGIITNNHHLPLAAASHAFFKEHSLLVRVRKFHYSNIAMTALYLLLKIHITD